ncbi:MAG: hypothetical protein ACYCOX_13485 [Acidobacteriaceae bacterium]
MNLPELRAELRRIERLFADIDGSSDSLYEIGRSLHGLANNVNAFARKRFLAGKMDRQVSADIKRSILAAEMFQKLLDGKQIDELAAEYGVSKTMISQRISTLARDLNYRATNSSLDFDVKHFQGRSLPSIKKHPDSWRKALDVFSKELALRASGKSWMALQKTLWGFNEK